MKATINAEGKTPSDLELAIEEALRLIRQGNLRGAGSNDDGDFSFEVTT